MIEKLPKGALFGGSFDPVHAAHLAIIKKARHVLELNRLIVLPNTQNPFKQSTIAPPNLRLKWLQQACASMSDVEVSNFEIAKKRSVYAIESVRHFAPQFDTLYFIIGADNLQRLSQWHEFTQLNQMVTWVVCSRDAIKIPSSMVQLDIDMPLSSTNLRQFKQNDFLYDEIEQFYKEFRARENNNH